jgi:hypothetical protein
MRYVENEGGNDPNFEKTKKLLEGNDSEEENEALDDLVNEFDKKKDKTMSKEFKVFVEATKSDPSQVIRYSRDGNLPIWSSKKNRLRLSDIPKCNNCGGKMTFEMQVMPALYNYVNELVNLNWNSVMIYTCAESCNPTNYEYNEEYAYVELLEKEEFGMDILDAQDLTGTMQNTNKKDKKSKNTKNGKLNSMHNICS